MDRLMLNKLKDALPSEPGINGKDEYINCAVLVLVMLIGDEYHFVFEKRAANIRQAGEICFPGGKFDPRQDKNFLETALRETVEELGVDAGKIQIIGRLETVIAPMGTTADVFLGVIDIRSLADLQINRSEVEKVFTVPVSYFVDNDPDVYKVNVTAHPTYVNEEGEEVVSFPAQKLGLPKRYFNPWPIAPYSIYAYRVAGEIIWGMTARLVRNVIAKIRETKGATET